MKRSVLDWTLRIAATLFVCALGVFTAVQSLALALPDSAIELAHRLAPFNARLDAELARYRLGLVLKQARDVRGGSGLATSRFAGPEGLAEEALRADPTAVPAVTTLALANVARGNTAAARRLHDYAERLSRRDLPTQIWMIEDAVARNDIPSALRHYDIALRTKWGAWDLLFPILARASEDAAIEPQVVRLLASRPAWAPNFVDYVSTNGPDPTANARFFRALRQARLPISDEAQARVVDRLIKAQQYEHAWAYYASIRPGADRRRSRDPDFNAFLTLPSQLDWTTADSDTGLTASIQRSGPSGLLDFFAPASVGGALVHQMQMLPPGRYWLSGISVGLNQPLDALPYWILTCVDDGRQLGRVVVEPSRLNGGRFGGAIDVPASCPVQYLALILQPSNVSAGVSGQITRAELRPLADLGRSVGATK